MESNGSLRLPHMASLHWGESQSGAPTASRSTAAATEAAPNRAATSHGQPMALAGCLATAATCARLRCWTNRVGAKV